MNKKVNQSEVTSHPDFDEHEAVVWSHDGHADEHAIDSNRLTAVIALHNTNLGPAVGGCRMYPYASRQDALADVLRLSRGMTYKAALAGVPMGGGKAVIIGDPTRHKNRELLLAMGDFVDTLGGRYVTAEDSGTSVEDLAVMAERTEHVSGVIAGERFGGDPSPVTALGVFVGITEAVLFSLHTDLRDVRVAVQGVGHVGFHLARMLVDAGARVVVSDLNPKSLARAQSLRGVVAASPVDILTSDVDVIAPCALGGAINMDNVRDIRATIIAGAANNQLASPAVGKVLHDRGLLYAPDYVVNAGGIIEIHYQRCGERDTRVVNDHVGKIATRLQEILTRSYQGREAD